nr:immunoglobulin heavy chain junction region [Macaca mulatta]MOV53540.1 immunoglobulin heavy chain junction region [Macaca mulatta]MOV53585.1 immunoglobulin heavy chain junction region [Macaca mulatta]MOV53605.1 immunoglobulin heavy chain junction region [Macaca mulatta]MOV53652.1 immunoglobulin heavy chain junction region [Macaca mulatta]
CARDLVVSATKSSNYGLDSW